jgi:peptide-methionine (S)-S-oxide reductase
MCAQSPVSKKKLQMEENKNTYGLSVATLGAGCFWCVEAVFQELKGVQKVVSGFMGGHVDNPSYKEVTTGSTGHAEVAQVWFDPSVISYEEILMVFWSTHDPTTPNRQGYDVGPMYRSAIFYHDESQKMVAEISAKEVATTLWEDPIITEMTEAGPFYIAEDYHQNFYTLNPNYGYCRAVINPKMNKFRKKFSHLLNESE